jgi:hypothetical protein
MVLLNAVCFGDRDDYIHGRVLSAQDSATGPGGSGGQPGVCVYAKAFLSPDCK